MKHYGPASVVAGIGALSIAAALVLPARGSDELLVDETPPAAMADEPLDDAPVEIDGPEPEAGGQLPAGALAPSPATQVARLTEPGPSIGHRLPGPPVVAPGQPAPLAPPTIDEIRAHLAAGDKRRALRAAEAFTDTHRWGRDRDAAWLLIGLIHREDGRHNLASEAFTRVRSADGPLASFGAWYEAEQDLVRGRAAVAVRECEAYRETWPDGPHAGACLRVIARGHAAQGHGAAARDAASKYDKEHPKAPIAEQIDLAIALWEAEHTPERAVRGLQDLAIDHRAALTGRVAEETLALLAADGIVGAAVPDDTRSLQSRAISLRESARRDDAWAVYQELVRRSADDPKLKRWVEDQAEVFGWRTRNWDFLAEWYAARYAASPNGKDAWDAHRVLGRGGRWVDAAEWARIGAKKHANTREWRGNDEEIGKTFLLAGAYTDARDTFDDLAKRGGWTGRRAEFYAAFAAHLEGDHDDAVARFGKIADRAKDYELESRYWRAKSLDALGKHEAAEADRVVVVAADPTGWYALLIRQQDPSMPTEAPFARAGTWPGAELPELPSAPMVAQADPGPVAAARWAAPRLREPSRGFGALTWPSQGFASLGEARTDADPLGQPVSALARRDFLSPPASYRASVLFDADQSRSRFRRVAEQAAKDWPVLQAIDDLSRVGLYDLSGPLFSQFYEGWRTALKSRWTPRHAAARGVSMPVEEWRQLFLHTRDHHHTARFLYGLQDNVTDPGLKLEAMRLGWPLAHDRYVWTHAAEHDIDPYLVLGLMRQESTYNAIAESPVGARGAMQIMPRTGHLLADLAHDTSYTAGDLEDPVFAVGYGIRYLGLLMERFDDVYPLAVASYNGGPHNVSAWLGGTGLEVETDVFVELIPYRETRHYVKVVTANYGTYLALYAPDGTRLSVPEQPRRDDPAVVDF